MAFTEQEKQLIAAGVAAGKTGDDIKVALKRYRLGIQSLPKPQPTAQELQAQQVAQNVADFKQNTSNAFKGGVEQFREGGRRMVGAAQKAFQSEDGIGANILESQAGLGDVVMGAGRAVGAPIEGLLTPAMEQAAPVIAPVAEGVQNVAEGMLGEAGAEAVGKTIGAAATAAGGAGLMQAGKRALTKGAGAVDNALQPNIIEAREVAPGVYDTAPSSGVSAFIEKIKESPVVQRTRINIEAQERQAENLRLAAPEVKDAVVLGVPRDVAQKLAADSPETVAIKQKMYEIAERGGTTGTMSDRPIMAVAPDMVSRISTIEGRKSTIGKAIGDGMDKVIGAGAASTRPLKNYLHTAVQEAGVRFAEDGSIDFKGAVTSFTPEQKNIVRNLYETVMLLPDQVTGHELTVIDDMIRAANREALAKDIKALEYRSPIDGKTHDINAELVNKIYEEVDVRAPNLRALRAEYRNLADLLQDMRTIFKIPDDAPINEELMVKQLRGLVNNTDAGAKIIALLKRMDEIAPSSVDYGSVTAFGNFLEDVAGAPSGSLKGIGQSISGVPTIQSTIVGLAGEALQKAIKTTGKTPETIMAGVKRLLETLSKPQRGMVNFGAIADSLTPAKKPSPAPKVNQGGSLVDDSIKNAETKAALGGGTGDALMEEARKYKSAEEFVNNQINVFHATNEAQAKSIEMVGFKPSLGRGFSNQPGDFAFFTPSVDGAIRYSKTSSNGLNKITSGHLKGKILEIEGNLPDFEAFGKAQEKLGVPLLPNEKGQLTMLDIDGLKAAMKKSGYSAIQFKDRYSNGARAIAAIPEDVVTKSQLTDIWNKANKK